MSPKSGSIYEKSLVVNYISTTGKDPVSDQPLSVEELVPINTTALDIVPPVPPTFSSIPSLLETFQNEWDSLALEVFTLRKQLHQTREELSAALYHHDAAVRVAARAIRERDEAKNALQELALSIGNGEPMEVEENANGKTHAPTEEGIPTDALKEARDELYQLHKTQKPSLPAGPEITVSLAYVKQHVTPFKKASASYVRSSSKTLLVGSPTGSVAIYNFNTPGKSNVSKIAHEGPVTAVAEVHFEGENLPIIAYNNVVVVGEKRKTVAHPHKGDVEHILVHPKLAHIVVLVSRDGSWSLNDVSKGSLYLSSSEQGVLSAALHGDGLLMALGNEKGEVVVFDISTGQKATTISTKHSSVVQILFAANGYWLLALSKDADGVSAVEVIDLRKNTVAHSIEAEHTIMGVQIDPSLTVVATYDAQNTVLVHRYTKKGKLWTNNASSRALLEVKSPLRALHLLTAVEDEDFVTGGRVSFAGVSENSSTVELELQYE